MNHYINMKRIIFSQSKFSFALLMFFIPGILTTQVVAQDVSPLYPEVQKALRLIDIDQSTKALESLNTLVKSNPADASLLYYLGYAQIKKGKLDEALASFDKGIQLNDKEPLNYVGKGYVKVLQNNPVETKQFFDKALLMTKSKNAAVLNGVGEAYIGNKQYLNEGLQLLLKSKSVNSKNAETFILLGDAYLQQNNGGLSVSSYENAAALDSKNAKPNFKIGQVYSRSKNVEAAIEAYDKAIKADPEYALAYKELGEIYYFKKDGVKAVEAQEAYLKLTENPEPGKLQLAFYLFMAKNYVKANEIFKQIILLPNTPAVAYRFYAKSLSEVGDLEESRKVFDQYFVKAKPEEILASDYADFGDALIKMKQDSLAINAYQNSLAIDSMQTKIRQLHAETLYRKKRYAEAVASFEKLLVLRAKPLAQDSYAIGRAYYYNGQMVEADSAFTRLSKMQPTMSVGPLWVARVKANQDPESTQGLAKPYFEKVVEIASVNPEKNKADLIESYRYLGYYSYLKKDNAKSKEYWQKVLTLAPKDPQATEALEILNKL